MVVCRLAAPPVSAAGLGHEKVGFVVWHNLVRLSTLAWVARSGRSGIALSPTRFSATRRCTRRLVKHEGQGRTFMFDACRGRSAVSATHSNVSRTAGTVAFALARRARWPRVWAATQRLEMASVWATEASSRPYGAGRAVETITFTPLRLSGHAGRFVEQIRMGQPSAIRTTPPPGRSA